MANPLKTVCTLLLEDITKIKKNLALRIVVCLIEDIVQEEYEIVSKIGPISNKKLRKAAEYLQDLEIIEIRLSESSSVYYILSKKYFDIDDNCRNCKLLTKKTIVKETMETEAYRCLMKKHSCLFKYILTGYNIWKFLGKRSKKIVTETYNRTIKKNEDRDVSNWTEKDFIDFYIERFQTHFSNMLTPSRAETKNIIKEISLQFMKKFKEHWRMRLKCFIAENFQEMQNHNQVPDIFNIRRIMGEFFKKDKLEISICTEYNIYCKFFRENGCILPEGQNGCTKELRAKMLIRYN